MENNPHTFNVELKASAQLPYLLALPDDYNDSEKTYPVMLFLHGMGERGNDLVAVRTHGPPKHIDAGESLPFIVISPQCPLDSWWDFHLDALLHLLDHIIANYRVDQARVYLTGLSMGGFGTWSLASQHPDRFAAIAPICGGMMHWLEAEMRIKALKAMPIWTFHGEADSVVPVAATQQIVDVLKALGSDVNFTMYPGVDHDSWTATYANPELYRWFLNHTRKIK